MRWILRPLNVPDADNLYGSSAGTIKPGSQSYPDYLDLRDRNRSFDDPGRLHFVQAALDTGQNPARAWVLQRSGNYFDALRIQPHLGRFFHPPMNTAPIARPYVVLSHAIGTAISRTTQAWWAAPFD